MSKKKIYKPKPISGFPEWLPEVRRAEQQWFDQIRRVFESYGFCNIETPSVEELDAINAKGGDGGADVDKEVYVLERLHKEEGDKEARLALHFDQTVPLARYTAQHFNDLVFPFKRYQMQRVWRGERPQAGRFREFYQCDIDVINVDQLPIHFDAEMPAIIWEILSNLPGMEDEKIRIRISNRKILVGFLEALGATDIQQATRIIDKLDKIGEDEVKRLLLEENILSERACNSVLTLIAGSLAHGFSAELVNSVADNTSAKNAEGLSTMREGAEELQIVMDTLHYLQPNANAVADLSIIRGLDYYTGTVYETVFEEDPSYGSICSGGRYDDLAGNYINKHLPGVGISIGFSRLFDRIRKKGKLNTNKKSPTDFLIALPCNSVTEQATKTAQKLRSFGHNVEVFHTPTHKDKKFITYAEKRGIKYIWFTPYEDTKVDKIRDIEKRETFDTKIEDWEK